MFQRKGQILAIWFLFLDFGMTILAWISGHWLRFQSGVFSNASISPPFISDCLRLIPLLLLVSAIAYKFAGQYDINRFRRLREEVLSILKGTALMGLLMIAANFSMENGYESRGAFFLFLGLAPFFLFLPRRISWYFIRGMLSQGFHTSKALIIGTGRSARRTAQSLERTSWLGIRNLGFVDDRNSNWAGDLEILGAIADLPYLVEHQRISHVFICLPLSRYHDARRVFDCLSQMVVDVRLVVDVPALGGISFATTTFDGMPMVSLRESPHFGLNLVVKRLMDIVFSLLALLILAPLMGLISLLIKLTSPGPVFFRQERCGLNGDSFMMLKFRSMQMDAENQTGAVWAVKDDPRRTWLGSFLRKTSMDELPQLINVLRGEMSLVGPRPERPIFIQQFKKTIPNYFARHCVKAGITGWAQVNGWRGNTSLRKRVQYDLYYIAHWTPWLDLRILLMTLWRGWINRNAY